ncbi:uncharacterized protein LOC127247214 [Andrographis paniculata]|uniref:uncharacterized protein LOC127247214 n=1 Tax=Andrographis paniculata TaxID=175694 RepID=UPI0021E734DD|nr:uncharacterized protein LOC127247214 [Andrographis paniculata]
MVVSIDIVKTTRGRSKSCFGCFSHHEYEPPSSAVSDDRKSLLRSFSGSLKSLFFKTPFVKKLRSKRHGRESSRSSSSIKSRRSSIHSKEKKSKSTTDELTFSEPEECFGDTASSSDKSSSLLTSTSPASSISEAASGEDFRHASAKNKIKLTVRRVGSMVNYRGMCLILSCLAALVFWGKALAIVTCTLTWLLFGPSSCAVPTRRFACNWKTQP